MKLKLSLAFFSLFTLLFGFLFSKSAFANNYSISGTVKDSSEATISGATVSVNDTNNDSTTTDSSGGYSLSVPAGTYNIQVTPPASSNFSSAVAPNYVVSTNSTLNFILVSAGQVSLSGHIYNSTGETVQGQSVILRDSLGTLKGSAISDSTGYYSIQVQAGTYNVILQANNNSYSLNTIQTYFFQVTGYSLSQSNVINFTIPTKAVTVHVQDSSGNAIAGVTVSALGFRFGVDLGNGLSVDSNQTNVQTGTGVPVTDQNGNTVVWLAPGGYTATLTPPSGSNYFNTSTGLSVTNNASQQVTLTIQSPVSLSGHVYNSTGETLAGQTVYLQDNLGQRKGTSTTDPNGFYSMQVQAGTYTLVLQANNNPYSLNTIQTYSFPVSNYFLGQNTILDLTVPARKITVHVQNSAGNAVNGVGVSALGFPSPSLGTVNAGRSTVQTGNDVPLTDQNGNTAIWLAPGGYTINLTPPAGSNYTSNSAGLSVTSDLTQQVTYTLLAPVTLSGYVYNSTSETVQGQHVLLRDSLGNLKGSAVSDSTGFYSIQVQSGTYNLVFQGSSNPYSQNTIQNYFFQITSYPLNQSTALNFTIPARKVIVHVQDASGNAITGVTVSAFGFRFGADLGNGLSVDSNQTNVSTGSNVPTTDQNGNTVVWLAPGGYTATLTPPNGSIYSNLSIGLNVTSDLQQTDIVQLQFIHTRPVTTISLLPVANGQGNYSDPTTVTLSATAASGYSIANTYYTLDGGSQQTYTSPFTVTGNGSHTITYWSVDNSGVPEAPNTKTFTILTTYSLSGTVFNDTNQNGFQDTGETGISGAALSLNTGQQVTTDSNGNYTFTGLVPGTYTETLSVPSGDVATTTNPATISLSTSTTQNFGIAPSGPVLVTALNAGGDTQGNFLADADYAGGTPYTSSSSVDTSGVTNPAPQAVYQTVRYGNSFSYNIPNLTPGNSYSVRLHFNELYWTSAGQRVFNVAINGNQVLSNFDIFATAGGTNKALVEQFNTTADSNGQIAISFSSVRDNAMVNGIEIFTGSIPTYSLSGTIYNDINQNGVQDAGETGVPNAVVTLNTGQTATTDSNGNYTFANLPAEDTYTERLTQPLGYVPTTGNPLVFSLNANTTENFGLAPFSKVAIDAGGQGSGSFVPDTNFTGGTLYTSTLGVDTSGATNPAPQEVYQSARYGNNFSYTISSLLPNTQFTLRLHFNELYWGTTNSGNGGVGSRVFNVAVNGATVLSNFDIFQTAGGADKAIVEEIPVTSDSNGNVIINFSTVTDNAIVNGIELLTQ